MADRGNVYQEGVSPNTRLLNPQRVRVFAHESGSAEMIQIGLMQTWNPSDTRTVEAVRGIGFGDQIAELAVGVTEHSATASMMMLYFKDIMQAFGYHSGVSGFIRSLKHHQWPFDVQESILIPKFLGDLNVGGEGSASGPGLTGETVDIISTTYLACWMTDYSKNFDIGATSVTQDMTCQITDIYASNAASDTITTASYSDTESNLSTRSTVL
jgi:hypothetical protein